MILLLIKHKNRFMGVSLQMRIRGKYKENRQQNQLMKSMNLIFNLEITVFFFFKECQNKAKKILLTALKTIKLSAVTTIKRLHSIHGFPTKIRHGQFEIHIFLCFYTFSLRRTSMSRHGYNSIALCSINAALNVNILVLLVCL